MRMRLPTRLRIVVPGCAAVAIAGVLGGWISVASFSTTPTLEGVLDDVAAVLSAPVVLLMDGPPFVASGLFQPPVHLRVVAAVALAASPLHAVRPRRATAVLSSVGVLAWLLCELILIAATA